MAVDLTEPLSSDMASLSVQQSSHRQDVGSFRKRVQLQKFTDRQATGEKDDEGRVRHPAGAEDQATAALVHNRQSSSFNDEAFESERKRTGKFKVEHLQEDGQDFTSMPSQLE